ncbi:MAG: MFS transporter [Desulfovibrio sp.]|nr:MFS transporter [Desulfovibrio sp.]MDY0258226.1 MFS transporter [Desulfovibrio sp.]
MGTQRLLSGLGLPPYTKILTTWYSRNECSFLWAVCNTSHNLGGVIIPLLAGWLAIHYDWRYGMIIPGIIGIVAGMILCIVMRDRPEPMGLPRVGERRKDQLEQVKKNESSLTTWQVLRRYVFTNKYICFWPFPTCLCTSCALASTTGPTCTL